MKLRCWDGAVFLIKSGLGVLCGRGEGERKGKEWGSGVVRVVGKLGGDFGELVKES